MPLELLPSARSYRLPHILETKRLIPGMSAIRLKGMEPSASRLLPHPNLLDCNAGHLLYNGLSIWYNRFSVNS